jgi:hypothetical protein
MAIFGNLGGVVSSGLNLLGLSGGALGAVGNIGSAFVSGLTAAPQMTVPSAGPVVQATPVMGTAPVIAAGGSVIARLVAPILMKLAIKLGKKAMSLRNAIRIIRRMGKILDPAAIAVALGISTAELAQLITAYNAKKTRRMNPANVHALRRSLRRLESFHRLCVRVDSHRRRRRVSTRGRACPTGGPLVVRGG